MTDDENKVVRLATAARIENEYRDANGENARNWRDASLLAKLATMPIIEYERCRLDQAKKLGWRPGFLDRTVERIREFAGNFRARYPRCKETESEPGHFVTYCSQPGAELARFEEHENIRFDRPTGKTRILLVLADGNGTPVMGVPTTSKDSPSQEGDGEFDD